MRRCFYQLYQPYPEHSLPGSGQQCGTNGRTGNGWRRYATKSLLALAFIRLRFQAEESIVTMRGWFGHYFLDPLLQHAEAAKKLSTVCQLAVVEALPWIIPQPARMCPPMAFELSGPHRYTSTNDRLLSPVFWIIDKQIR